jgi:glycine hydroxymethyltransferase
LLSKKLSTELRKIRHLSMEQHRWRGSCINLIASENVASPAVREVLASDFQHRYAEGKPYKRHYQGTKYIDEIESIATELAKQLFAAQHVNIQPISGCLANLAVYYTLTKVGDTLMVLPVSDGGHISHMSFGGAGLRGIRVTYLPFDKVEMNVDLDAAAKAIRKVKPKVIMLGGSIILFPPPVKQIRVIADGCDAHLAYDAAHVLGLIAGGQFQSPLREGAQIISSSTHKTFPGPQGGIILCGKQYADKVDSAVLPGLQSNHHLHHIVGLAIALLEMLKFGKDYASQTVKNAKSLAENLYNYGFKVLGEHKGFTESHQVLIAVTAQGGGDPVAKLLEQGNIICNKNLIPGDSLRNSGNPSGLRLGTAELTRLGMKESDMSYIARLFKQLVLNGEDPRRVGKEVNAFMKKHSTVHYCFRKDEAYRYIKFY